MALIIPGRCLHLLYADDEARLSGNHPAAVETLTSVGAATPETPLAMEIRYAVRNQKELDRLLDDLQNPASSRYHHWLKTGEFARRFGPSKAEIKAVGEWLKTQGFAVSPDTSTHLEFRGNVAQAESAFRVSIARFGDGSAYANTSDPVIPPRFAGVIGAILGMDNMARAIPASRLASDSDGTPIGQAIINGGQAFGPGDVRTFYDEAVGNGDDGGGDCIAIIGTSDFLDSAMSAFTGQFGLPPINYTRELHGADPGINTSSESEAELDLQWAHTAAPGASIVYHLGASLVTDIGGAVNDNQCGAISISFVLCAPSASLIRNTLDPLFAQAAAQGQSVFVSSGDNGAAGYSGLCLTGNSRSVNELSADPNVTSVGGTQFTPSYSGGNDVGHVNEKVWNDNFGASGGGASQFFGKPAYQTGAGVPDDNARDLPDVALIASPHSPGVFWGHDVGGAGQISCCIGGTSLAAPIWAGFSRVIAELSGTIRLGNLNFAIYGLANSQLETAGFHDVTTGNNNFGGVVGFNAEPGYDQATGWGSIDFNTFALAVKNLIQASATPTPTATQSSTATPTLTPTSTSSATATSIATVTSTATSTSSSAPTAKPTSSETATATPTPTSTVTATAVLTTTPMATPTPFSTPTLTPTISPTPGAEPTGGTLSVPSSVRFPTLGIGMPAMTKTLTIKNRSASSALAFDVPALQSPFQLIGAGHYSLPPLTPMTFGIVFTPNALGSAGQNLVINSGDPKHPVVNVAVVGMVAPGRLAAPGKVTLTANSGTTSSKTLILRNSGKGMLSGVVHPFAPGSPMTLIDAPVSFDLAPGQTQPITIQFSPSGRGTINAALSIETTPPPASSTIAVVGNVRR